jgi:hypothetical protein
MGVIVVWAVFGAVVVGVGTKARGQTGAGAH